MDLRLAGLLLATAALPGISSASAQVAEPGAMPAGESTPGSRVDGSDGGFKLVTLGVWAQPNALLQTPAAENQSSALFSIPKSSANARRHREADLRRSAFLAHVSAAEAQFGLPPGLLDALIWTESRYNPFAISRAGAVGLGQLMPSTANDLGVVNRYDGRANLWASARYLHQLLEKFGVVHLAVAAYNAGPGAVERAGGIPLNGETPSYVRSVLAFWGAR